MQIRSWPTALNNLIFASLLGTLLSCGKGFEDDSLKVFRQEEIANINVQATLSPLNKRFGTYTGYVGLSIIENQFWARIKVFGPISKEKHAQYLHQGSRCPTMKDDLNGDGYLDFEETYKVAGNILLPFDSNLNTQMRGFNDFPVIRRNNLYYYSESCNSSWLMDDLRSEDPFLDDVMVKLQPNEDLSIETRIVIIYGINSDTILPSSVKSLKGYGVHAMMPIACGKLVQGTPDEFEF